MIEFMVIAAPRSGTTWAANWLTTDTTLCLHDPLFTCKPHDLDAIKSVRRIGIACTGIAYFPEWLKAHPARKVILHRPAEAVDASLAELGLPPCAEMMQENLAAIDGMHCQWTDLWEKPRAIYEYLLGLPFDAERHAQLDQMNVQVQFDRVAVNPETVQCLVKKILA